MGKMNISNNKKTNSGMPNWLLSLVVIAVLVIVVAACLISSFASWGIIPRLTTAMKSENFSINQNMMTYYFQGAYSEFTSDTTYTTFKNNCSLNTGTNEGLPLDQQKIGGGQYDYLLAPNFDGQTWHDFFISKTEEKAKNVLSYCEEAYANSITLEEADDTTVEKKLEDLFTNIKYAIYMQSYDAQSLYMSDSECLGYYFGKGVSRSDIKKAIELETLYEKCSSKIYNDLSDAVTTDRINAEYAENSKNYDLIDYLNYSFDVKYDQVSKDVLAEIGEDAKAEDHEAEILAAYKAEIEKAAGRAEALSKITNRNEFIKTALTYFIDDNYDDLYEDVKEDSKLDAAKAPSAEDEAKIKDAMIAKMFEELLAVDKKDTAVDDYDKTTKTVYGIAVTEEYGSFISALKSDIYSELVYEESYVFIEKEGYTEPAEGEEEKENIKWLYSTDRKIGDSIIFDEGDGADGAEVKADKKSYSVDIYCMLKPRYADETIVRHGAYMVFTNSTDASSTLAALGETTDLTVDKFIQIAASYGAGTYSELENYIPGQLGSEAFDDWMFDDARKKGDYTKDVITISSSYVIGYFEEVGTLKAWEATVKNTLLSEDLTVETQRVNNTYSSSIIVKTNVMNKLGK